MKLTYFTTSILAFGLMTACSQAENVTHKTAEAAKTTEAGKTTATDMANEALPGANISDAPSGTYLSEAGHAYIAFSYDHQGYSKPILRWGEFEARVELDSETPENSTLSVTIPVSSIDSGVEVFDGHLVSADFFDAENHPNITFTSTGINQTVTGSGTLTGDLTIKGITHPVTLVAKLNKVGNNFRSGKDMFGISARGLVTRADFGLDKYPPVARDIFINVEVEFVKAD